MPRSFETKLFPLVDESLFKNCSSEQLAAKLLNEGLKVINSFLRFKLKNETKKYHAIFLTQTDTNLLRAKTNYLAERYNIENRETLLHYYIDKKVTIPGLKYPSRFALFQAKDLVAIADMLDIVLERIQKEMSAIPESSEKTLLQKELKKLEESRKEIVACMKEHLNLAHKNSQQRKENPEMMMSFMDIQKSEHGLVSVPGLPEDKSLADQEFTPHPMRIEFKRQNDPVFAVNEIFCLEYIYKHGSDEDRNWLKEKNGYQFLKKYINWYTWYTTEFYKLLPDPNNNPYAGLVVDAYHAVKPIAQTIYNELFDWGKTLADISGVSDLIKSLEKNENFQQIKVDVTTRITAFTNYLTSLHSKPVEFAVPKSELSISDSQLQNSNTTEFTAEELHRSKSAPSNISYTESNLSEENKKQKFKEAMNTYNKYCSAFSSLEVNLKNYLHKIKNAQGCGAITQYIKDGDGVGFIKNFFFTRKIKAHSDIVNAIEDHLNQLRYDIQPTKENLKPEFMENIQSHVKDFIQQQLEVISQENNHYPSELAKILHDAYNKPILSWNDVEQLENDDVREGLLASS